MLNESAYLPERQKFFKEKLESLDERNAARTENSAIGNGIDDIKESANSVTSDIGNMADEVIEMGKGIGEGVKKLID